MSGFELMCDPTTVLSSLRTNSARAAFLEPFPYLLYWKHEHELTFSPPSHQASCLHQRSSKFRNPGCRPPSPS